MTTDRGYPMARKPFQYDLSLEDRHFIRKWKFGVLIAYAVLALALAGFSALKAGVRTAGEVVAAEEK
jgi:hypothetical protein